MEWITANDNSNEEKSTIKVILVAATVSHLKIVMS